MYLYEIVIAFVAVCVGLLCFMNVFGLKRINMLQMFILVLCMAAMIFFSVNMVSDTITVDEIHYMNVIVNLKNVLDNPVMASKLMLQYRTSQMIFGTFFTFMSEILVDKNSNIELVILYKILHWIVFYVIELVIVMIFCKKYLKRSKGIWKNILSWLVTFSIVFALPMSVSVMKICNYDASNVMFGTLGIILVGVDVIGTLQKGTFCNAKYSWLGLFMSILGCLDKWSSGVYFIICAILCCFAKLIRSDDKKVGNKIKIILTEPVKIVFFSLLCGYANLQFIRLVLWGGVSYEEIKFGHVAFPFTNLFAIIFEGVAAESSQHAILYVLLLYLVVLMISLLFFWLYTFIKENHNVLNILNIFCILGLIVVLIAGIYGTFFVPQRIGPWDKVDAGEYSSKTVWGEYHYNANSWLGHKAMQIIYAFATLVCNFPTSISILLLMYIILFFRKKINESIYQIVLGASIAVIIIFACMNQPSAPRYFGVPILLLCLSSWGAIYNSYILDCNGYMCKKIITITSGMILLWIIELILYIPNISFFSPLWCYHSKEWGKNVRLGQWYAGEAMSWGEELAIAGRKIDEMVKQGGMDAENITIFSNYGLVWLKNPGYIVKRVSEIDDTVSFDDTIYFVLTKKALFRMEELPPFLYEVEPLMVSEYKGEITTWIYSGTQLENYRYYFGL